MATIRKRGSRWQVQIRRDGHPPISKSFLHKTDAHQWARQIEIEIDRTDLPSSAAKLRNIRLEDLVIRFRDEVVSRKRSVLTETTILNAFLRQPIAKLTLAQLRPQVVAEYRDQRLAILKPSTVRREFGLLRRLLNVAKSEWSIPLTGNPFAAVAQPRCVDHRTRRVSAVELARLRAAAGRLRNKTLASVFEFAIETSMRRGEILSLRWEHVNLSARTAFLPMTKNGHSRLVPLTRTAVDILNAVEGVRDGIVFAISSNAVRLAWERLCRRAKVDDLHFHDLRHEAISRFFEKGLSMPEVALISGHRDPRMLFRYTHLQAEELARKLSTIAQSEQRPADQES